MQFHMRLASKHCRVIVYVLAMPFLLPFSAIADDDPRELGYGLRELVALINDPSKKKNSARVDCGSRCLYVYACLQGKTNCYNDLKKHLPDSLPAVSLTQLRHASSAIGVQLDAVRCYPESLANLPLPAIALLEGDAEIGHYVLLLQIGDRWVTIWEPTTGQTSTLFRTVFLERATGLYLCAHEDSDTLVQAASFVSLLLLLFILTQLSRRSPRKSNPSYISALLVVALWSCSSLGCNDTDVATQRSTADLTSGRSVANRSVQQVKLDGRASVDLGFVDRRAREFRNTFKFRNITGEVVRFAIDASTCSCVVENQIPDRGILTEGGCGSVDLVLFPANAKAAGPIAATARLQVIGTDESHLLEFRACIPGISYQGITLLKRPRQQVENLEAQNVLSLHGYHSSSKCDIQIRSIAAYHTESDSLASGLTSDGPTISDLAVLSPILNDKDQLLPFPEISAELSSLAWSSAKSVGSLIHESKGQIIINVGDIRSTRRGYFIIHYLQGGDSGDRTSKVPFIVSER